MRTRLASVLRSALLGAVPGLVLLLLSIPVGGDLDLTLGVGGIFLAIVGLLVGAMLAATRAPR